MIQHSRPKEDADDASDRQSASLAGLAATLLLVIVALATIRQLQIGCLTEDCLLARRQDCAFMADKLRVAWLILGS